MDRSILNKSTTPDFEPVSGFALTSICGMTHEGPSVCKQLEEYLLSKLAKDHTGVKLKVLRILKYVCENGGSIEFRRLLQRRSDIIRQCQSYRGTTDPLRGDAPNKEVRDEAQNVMKALFAAENTTASLSAAHGATTLQPSRIQSVSSSDFGGYSAPSNFTTSTPSPLSAQPQFGGRQMASMGNPNFQNYEAPTRSSSLSLASLMTSENPGRDIISAMTSGVQSVAETLAKSAQPYISNKSAETSSRGHYSSSAFPPPTYDYPPSRPTSWTPPQVVQQTSSYPTPVSPDTTSIAARNLVNELCVANSARTNPTQQSLDSFVQKAENLDGSILGQILATKLSDAQVPWVHKMKILSCIEAVHGAGFDLVISSFLDNGGASALISLLHSVQCGTRARQVGSLLGLVGGKPQPPVQQPTKLTTHELINFDDDDVDKRSTNLIDDSSSPTITHDLLQFEETTCITTPQTSLI